MRGEIICIGDELICGRVPDRNSGYVSSRLWSLGIAIGAITVVGDDAAAIKDALHRALDRSDFVVVSGGLGTTEDDITAALAAEVFQLPMAESKRMVKNLKDFFRAQGRRMSDEVRKMAWLPAGAEILGGASAGFRLSGPKGQPVYFLPGVPAELRHLTDSRVTPELLELMGPGLSVETREVRTFGMPESQVGKTLAGISGDGLKLGFYPVFPEVQVVITAQAEKQAEAAKRAEEALGLVASRLQGYVVSTSGKSLEKVVGEGLAARGLSVALAESCTGGLIGHRLTSVSGSSAYFERGMLVYSNQAKEDMLGVRAETLEAHGAVSAQTAAEMASGARARAGTDLGLAVTGIAGPTGGSPEKPVGTVYFGLAAENLVRTGGYRFHGSRSMVKAQAAEQALDWLRRYLEDDAFLCGD